MCVCWTGCDCLHDAKMGLTMQTVSVSSCSVFSPEVSSRPVVSSLGSSRQIRFPCALPGIAKKNIR